MTTFTKDTFGNSKACEVLAERLNKLNNRHYSGYISAALSKSNKIVNEILKIEDEQTVSYLLELHSKSIEEIFYTKSSLPESLISYANNVAQSKIKRAKRREV